MGAAMTTQANSAIVKKRARWRQNMLYRSLWLKRDRGLSLSIDESLDGSKGRGEVSRLRRLIYH